MQVPPSFVYPVDSPDASLATVLDAYQAACAKLVAQWPDADAYPEARMLIARIRGHGASVPPLGVLALQLAIAHAELEAALWQKQAVGMEAHGLREVVERHTFAVHALRLGAASLLGEYRAAPGDRLRAAA